MRASAADRNPNSIEPRVTVFTRSYPPAFLRGGPARSVHAIVQALAAEFKFSVITSAFDDVAAGPMRSVEANRWTTLDHAMIWYESEQRMSVGTIVKRIKETEPRLIYLNSLFDYRFAVLPLLIARTKWSKVPVILAPRGELSVGALTLKRWKKRAFIAAFRSLRLHQAVVWHASTSEEKRDIERVFGASVDSHIAIDLCASLLGTEAQHDSFQGPPEGLIGRRLVFFSRIVPKKNLVAALRAISLIKGSAHLTIAGPIEDAKYWRQCLALIGDMPDSKSVSYWGVVEPHEVVDFLARFDLFVFPTLGENFGHVVLESLAAGTPVIVGKDTPWHQVEASGAGWICSPTCPDEIAGLIERFLSLDKDTREEMRMAARRFACKIISDPDAVNASRSMFRTLISVGSP